MTPVQELLAAVRFGDAQKARAATDRLAWAFQTIRDCQRAASSGELTHLSALVGISAVLNEIDGVEMNRKLS